MTKHFVFFLCRSFWKANSLVYLKKKKEKVKSVDREMERRKKTANNPKIYFVISGRYYQPYLAIDVISLIYRPFLLRKDGGPLHVFLS